MDAEPYRVKVTHYVTADGTRCASTAPGAQPKVVETRTYYGTVGGKRVSLRTRDKGTAWVELRRLQRQHADRAAGIIGEAHDLLARPLAELMDEWVALLGAKGTTEDHRKTVRTRLRNLADAAGWLSWGGITSDSLLKGLAKLRAEGLSHQTSNHYRTAAKGFAAWLADRAGARNPLARAGGKLSPEADPRHPRRSPSDADVGALFAYLDGEGAPARKGMTGKQRALGYRLCMATGLRASELRSLTRDSFPADCSTVTVAAAYSKHRRQDVLHLPAWLSAQLVEWFAAGGGCWPFPREHQGRVLQRDLKAAGVPYRTEEGFFDFHALRHWFVTAVANQPGISPKTLMTVCRHSTAQLSLAVYAKSKTEAARAAAEGITEPGTNRERKEGRSGND